MLRAKTNSVMWNQALLKAPRTKRGRKSTIPPEQREQVRKIKKQNMERRRRACITDKMNALHTLAMRLIGEDPAQYQKAEKADILHVCYVVFEKVIAIIKDQPDIHLRLRQFTEQLRDRLMPDCTALSFPLASPHSEEKENQSPGQTRAVHIPHSCSKQTPNSQATVPRPERSVWTDSGLDHSDASSDPEERGPLVPNKIPAAPHPVRLPLKHRLPNNHVSLLPDPSLNRLNGRVDSVCGNTEAEPRANCGSAFLWRPYLD